MRTKKRSSAVAECQKNVAWIDNLNQHKAPPALALFSNELTTALENEHKEAAKGTHGLLRMLNEFIFQPFLIASVSKGSKMKEAMIFLSPDDIH